MTIGILTIKRNSKVIIETSKEYLFISELKKINAIKLILINITISIKFYSDLR